MSKIEYLYNKWAVEKNKNIWFSLLMFLQIIISLFTTGDLGIFTAVINLGFIIYYIYNDKKKLYFNDVFYMQIAILIAIAVLMFLQNYLR